METAVGIAVGVIVLGCCFIPACVLPEEWDELKTEAAIIGLYIVARILDVLFPE